MPDQATVQGSESTNSLPPSAPVSLSPQDAPPIVTNGANPQGEVHQVPQGAWKKIKEQEREKGRKAALLEYQEKMQQLGVSSFDEALEKLAKLKQPPETRDSRPNENRNGQTNENKRREQERQQRGNNQMSQKSKNGKQLDPIQAKYEAKLEEQKLAHQKDKESILRKWRGEERKRKEVQKTLEARDAEMSLRDVAARAGVKDVDYALRLLTRELNGKDIDALKSFDEEKFFGSLKEDKPYLFGEVVKPATTGVGAGAEPPPPGSQEAATKAAAGEQVDARKMDQKQYYDRLRQLGLSAPT